ncbi:MAG: PIG-L deacetylase family protein [Nocardioidaceae bacterium]
MAELPPSHAVVVVLAAHPDDEVLALGGMLAELSARGCDLAFVTATDGEACHPHSPTISPAAMARVRARELVDALHELGVALPRIERLHLPDGMLERHRSQLAQRLDLCINGADLVLAPWRHDGHPDHDVVGDLCSDLCGSAVTLWEYPVWTWHWAEPGDERVPWSCAARIPLSDTVQAAKRAAIARFASQTRPLSEAPADAAILPAPMLAHFDRPFEVVFR